MGLGNPPTRLDLVLGLERLNGLAFHEPADLVAAAEAGMSIDETLEQLAARIPLTRTFALVKDLKFARAWLGNKLRETG